jgi:radical SAM protein with 4Fe4S-binding SPASM domain
MDDFVRFYDRALAYILKLNRNGFGIMEAYTTILLTHILTPFSTGYVDLRSPAGAGLGTLVYNYDGGVYASDESRMLAAMGDETFKLGTVDQSYADFLASPALGIIRDAGVAENLPVCRDCVYVPYCGADPVHAYATQGDPLGHRPTSSHCTRHMGLFQILFRYLYEADPQVIRTFLGWVMHRPPRELMHGEGQ